MTGDWADSSTLAAAGALDAFFSVRLGWLPTCFSVPRRPREASKRSTRAAEDASGAKERRKSPRFFYSAMGQPLPRTFDDWAATR